MLDKLFRLAADFWGFTEEEAYRFGRDAGCNGPTTTNAHYRIFSTPQNMAAWQRGYDEAKREKGDDYAKPK